MQLPLILDRAKGATLVDQIVEGVRQAIDQRRLRTGDSLPSIRSLARAQGISAFTVAEAYSRLASIGVITSRRGSGYRVADAAPGMPPPVAGWAAPSLNAAWLLSDVFADHSVPIKAGCGWIPGEWINEGGIQHAFRALSRVPGPRFGGYGHPFGMASLRELIAGFLRQRSVPADASNILLTQGATQALDLVVRTLLRPGDTVVVEDPCYCNLLQILQLAGLHVIGVRRTVDGVELAALEQVVAQARPKAIFVNTVLQNPSGASMSLASAFRLLQLADRHGLWVIEDDIYRDLAPAAAPCLAAMEGLSRVINISGFSKTISPMLRVGFIAAHRDLLAELARTKMAVGLTSSEVAERVAANILLEGHYDRHVSFLVEKLKGAHERVAARMHDAGVEVFHLPRAGLFLWARLPIDPSRSADVATEALAHGIWLAPGSYFRPGDVASDWFRFNVATSDVDVLWDFVRRLSG